MYALFNHTKTFGYYLPMSALITKSCKPNYQADGIKEVKICFGYGRYDLMFSKPSMAAMHGPRGDRTWSICLKTCFGSKTTPFVLRTSDISFAAPGTPA
jgi:hypothetical protein